MPWRADRDPYRIWISEVMLQQTQVATVIPYFERFVHAFPTLADLAQAEEQQVLHQWQGLGYYRRARHLHQAAKKLLEDHQGELPNDPVYLRSLPGMGRYTVNAVLSQAFDHRLPILEANSVRVLCRLFGRTEDPKREPLQSWLWQAAEDLLPPRKHVGEINQAIMELGSLVCRVQDPHCDQCPLRTKCLAREMNLQASIPHKAPPPVKVAVRELALVIYQDEKVLLVQRPANADRWASLWEMPHLSLQDNEDHGQAAQRLLLDLGLEAELGDELLTIRHGVTRFAITMRCFHAKWEKGSIQSEFYVDHRWLSLEDLANYPVSSPQRRLIEKVVQGNPEF